MRRFGFASVLSAAVLLPAAGAAAQDWTVDFGAGAIVRPEYLGADDTEALALPYVSVSYCDRLTFRPGDGLTATVWRRDGLEIGATANIRFGRNAQIRVDGVPLDEIDDTFEAGVYGRYSQGEMSLGVSWRTDVGDVHGGDLFEAQAAWRFRVLGAFGKVGPTVRWGSSSFNDTYLATSSVRSDGRLPDSGIGSGVQTVGIAGTAIRPIAPPVSAVAVVRIDRLVGDAEESAIVESATQVFVGAFLPIGFSDPNNARHSPG